MSDKPDEQAVTPEPPPEPIENGDANQWAMFIHLSQYAGIAIPVVGLLAPIIIWQLKKDEYPQIDQHGREVLNWYLSLMIYFLALCVVSVVSTVITFGILGFIWVPLWVLLGAAVLVPPLIAGIRANDGIFWPYPLTLRLIK